MEEGKPTPNPENLGFRGINPSPTAGEVGSIGSGFGLVGGGEWLG